MKSPDQSLLRTARDWETLAVNDPLWAIMVDPRHKDNGWPLDEFLESGRRDWAEQQAWLDSLGLPTSGARALDFGCGVGRLSQALSASFDSVVGLDISETMLKGAADLAASLQAAGKTPTTAGTLTFRHSRAADLHSVDDLAPFDLIYTVIVLQHVPAEIIPSYLKEFVRLLKPGGTLSFQLPERPVISVKGLTFRYLPAALIGFLQRRLLAYPAPMRMNGLKAERVTEILNEAGATVVATRRDDTYKGYWHSNRYIATRNPL